MPHCEFLTERALQSMSTEQLVKDFHESGLDNVLGRRSTFIPHHETKPAPVQTMRTRTAQKKDKGELRSKKNQDRQSKQPDDPPVTMDPEEEEVPSSSEEEDLQPRRPPYLAPIPPQEEPLQ